MSNGKKSPKFWLCLIIFSLVGQIAWVMENMYLNVFIYERFAASAQSIAPWSAPARLPQPSQRF